MTQLLDLYMQYENHYALHDRENTDGNFSTCVRVKRRKDTGEIGKYRQHLSVYHQQEQLRCKHFYCHHRLLIVGRTIDS